jgi:peptidoglycan hydrolase-like protein with peptidoglycan-binding domain
MPFSLTWLPTVLKNAGLKVAEVDGWPNRGRAEIDAIKGVMCHHTAGPKIGNMPSLKLLVNGRSDLPGPLAQLGLGRDGTYYVIAAGRANHAGAGSWQGLTTGNSSFIGIEAENTGVNKPGDPKHDPWPEIQLDAYRRGVAAILKHIGQGPIMCCGHKEYAPGRKPDPHTLDMSQFRKEVAAIMDGAAPPPRLIPNKDAEERVTLRRGSENNRIFLVKEVQRKVGLVGPQVDGVFGPLTEAALRNFQRNHELVPDGIVGPNTWAALDGVSA